jgi:hypothetical protein
VDDVHQQVGIRLGHRVREEGSAHYRELLTWGGRDFSELRAADRTGSPVWESF